MVCHGLQTIEGVPKGAFFCGEKSKGMTMIKNEAVQDMKPKNLGVFDIKPSNLAVKETTKPANLSVFDAKPKLRSVEDIKPKNLTVSPLTDQLYEQVLTEGMYMGLPGMTYATTGTAESPYSP